MTEEEFKSSIEFSNSIVEVINNETISLLEFLDGFKKVYDREEKKIPYHINLIDELHASENAHSRILEKLLCQQEPINKNYEILESFIQYISEISGIEKDFRNIDVKEPLITQETERIDLWIRETNKYAIIIENKVNSAIDQDKQIERYINKTKDHFDLKQIYVLYLPPTYGKEPGEESWGNYYNSDIYRRRYLNLSFKDDILPWLKNHVLPNIRLKDIFLSSALEQYIDHLEGLFSLRTINNKMNMALQDFIKEKLGLKDNEPEKSLKIVQKKKEDLQNALIQLTELEKRIYVDH
jgi:hypothetical protein